jgi:DNA-directed RNA polymerase specialized sigma24 family protein
MWVAEPEFGGVTQAKRLDLLPARLCEVAVLMTGEAVAEEDWDLDIAFDALGAQAANLRRRRIEILDAGRQLYEETRDTARALRARGMNLRDIGTMTGVTFQRVHQLVHEDVADQR